MKERERALIALLLGEEKMEEDLRDWLRTAAGRREKAAYREALEVLDQAYGRPPLATPPVYYTTMRAPIGRICMAATEDGLVRVSFRDTDASFAADLRRRLGRDVVRSGDQLRSVADQLDGYFSGRRTTFELPLDLSIVTPFQRKVLQATSRVPAGKVASYADIARRIGQPRASRAVGQALGRNPVPIVIPCHRVVATGGGLGGYVGGLTIKRRLLKLEGCLV